MSYRYLRFVLIALLFSNLSFAQSAADYAIQLTATIQESPTQITLSWSPIPGASSYAISKKTKAAGTWTFLKSVPATDSSYTDTKVVADSAFEYSVEATGPTDATGYIYAGIKAPAMHNKGLLELLVDSTFTDSCSTLIAQLMQDMSGDGWLIKRHDVSRTLSDTDVKAILIKDASATTINAVLLLGHIAVPYSGDLNPDGHPNHLGAWPADIFYGNFSRVWTDSIVNDTSAGYAANRNRLNDGKWDFTLVPAATKLELSRIDFYNMPAFGKTEVQLMRSYLMRDHIYKMDSLAMSHRSLIDDNFGGFSGEAFAANGWRNFPVLVGKNNIQQIDFISSLNDSTYQWAYGCGGGTFTSASGIGSTSDFTTNHVNGIFTMLFGSYFGDWNVQDNFLRAPLCADIPALTSCWAGRPNWFFHHMALGENIGYATRLTQDNSGLYSPTGYGAEFVHIALMGDLTLRTDYIKPVSNIAITAPTNGGAHITWHNSPDTAVEGYYVYRADSLYGFYQRISNELNDTSYYDTAGGNIGLKYYMVRPVKLQTTPSGSYYNLGIGLTDTFTVSYPTHSTATANITLQDNDVIIYPNPASKTLYVQLTSKTNDDATLSITDISGRKLICNNYTLKQGKNQLAVAINKLAAGTYLLTIKSQAGMQTAKWIKQN
ncbi:MAG: T9SS type A sorting domain-containing protein [Flavipsychrobacter sp.]